MYSIIDIETTGGNQPGEKITEIAIYVHNGIEIIDSFHTLINPERNIPYNITRITGIDNKMVANAPKFYEVAKQIVEITEGTIFVAHNVHFDYNFIKREFKELGFDYNRQFVCTIKLSRQILPGHASYSLGKICNDLDIQINGRHRADGDALATVKLFEILLQKNAASILTQVQQLPNYTFLQDPSQMEHIPEVTGVYYFKNVRNELIYVGKSRNIRKRIMSHLSNNSTRKAIELRGAIQTIDYVDTGSELIALLKESTEIKKNLPVFNKAQRKTAFNFGLFTEIDANGYIIFSIKSVSMFDTPIIRYTNVVEAKEELFNLVEKFHLCQKLTGLYKTDHACFNFTLKNCNGACCGKETVEAYNHRANEMIKFLNPLEQNLIIIDKGRNELEKAVVVIEDGTYLGWGYIAAHLINDINALKTCIIPEKENKDLQKIIKSFVTKHKVENIIYF